MRFFYTSCPTLGTSVSWLHLQRYTKLSLQYITSIFLGDGDDTDHQLDFVQRKDFGLFLKIPRWLCDFVRLMFLRAICPVWWSNRRRLSGYEVLSKYFPTEVFEGRA